MPSLQRGCYALQQLLFFKRILCIFAEFRLRNILTINDLNLLRLKYLFERNERMEIRHFCPTYHVAFIM